MEIVYSSPFDAGIYFYFIFAFLRSFLFSWIFVFSLWDRVAAADYVFIVHGCADIAPSRLRLEFPGQLPWEWGFPVPSPTLGRVGALWYYQHN